MYMPAQQVGKWFWIQTCCFLITRLKLWIGWPILIGLFFLYDPVYSYHYSAQLMEQLTGNSIIPNLNVGAVGLKSELIDWDKLELWIGLLEEEQGTSYLLEQALSAMLASGSDTIMAPREDYVVMPGKTEIKNPSAILHHYVAESKEWYYKKAWQAVI